MPINRREFIGIVAAGVSTTAIPNLSVFPAGAAEPPFPPPNNEPRPSWLGQMPLVIASNFDSFPLFRRREGGGTTWQEEEFEKEASEEAVSQLHEAGVTMVITHLFKGFGIEAERESLGNSKQLTNLANKYGMKVGLYVGSTIAYETFLLERPEAEEWFVPDFMGKPVFYDSQTFRKRVYFMHPGYREYIRRVLEIGEREFRADLIHFDNTSMQAQPAIFQHPLAVSDFREYLKNKYSREELKKRLGFADVKYVVPPKYDRPLTTINDPLFQEWTDFRCHQLNAYYAEMEEFLRQLNPQVAVESNPHAEMSGRNTIWEQGVYYPKLLAHMDAVWTEEGNPAGVTEDGILVNRIRSFKNASILHNTLFTNTGSSVLQMAESLAFGRQCIGDIGGDILSAKELPKEQRNYIKFFHHNFEHYRDIDDVADVGLLYSYATMGFNNDRPQVSFMLYGQALIQAKVPFAIIFNEHLKDLSKYRVLVLADQECLDEDKLELIRNFVRNGGGLVATEQTSLYTEWRLRKPDFGLKELFGVTAPPWQGRAVEKIVEGGMTRKQFGAGRVVYIPEVKPAIAKPHAVWMTSQYWKLPVNWQELIEAVRWAGGDQLSLEVKAPLTVVTQVTEQKMERKLLVHFLNYDVARVPRVTDVVADLKIPEAKNVKGVSLLTPDGSGIPNLHYTVRNGRVTFTVPVLQTYSLVAVQMS